MSKEEIVKDPQELRLDEYRKRFDEWMVGGDFRTPSGQQGIANAHKHNSSQSKLNRAGITSFDLLLTEYDLVKNKVSPHPRRVRDAIEVVTDVIMSEG